MERDDFEALLDAGDQLYASEDYEEALRAYEQAIQGAPDDHRKAEGYCAVGDALLALGRAGESLHMYRKAVDLDAEQVGGYCGQADVHFERWELDRALVQAREALVRDPDYARAHYLMGLIHEKLGDDAAALDRFRRAANLDPEFYPFPLRLQDGAADGLVREAMRGLPASVQDVLAKARIEVAMLPSMSDAMRWRESEISPQIPGVLLEDEDAPGAVADDGGGPRLHLLLYVRNLEKVATSPESFVDEVQGLVMQEVADYLEWSEDRGRNATKPPGGAGAPAE